MFRHAFCHCFILFCIEKSQAGDNEVVEPQNTWIHEIFQGVLTNETQCLSCETVRSKDEDFLDLSIDLEQNTSITQCLKYISNLSVIVRIFYL